MPVPKLTRLRYEIVDREAIRDCIYRYCRGVDRCDERMLRSAYWEDAEDDHLIFKGGREEFIAWALPLLRERESCTHSISNILIRVHENFADAESYFQGYHVLGGGKSASLQGGRYLDRFEKRGGQWRIIRRKVVVDWFRNIADPGDWAVGPQGMAGIAPGGRFPDDASYSDLDLT